MTSFIDLKNEGSRSVSHSGEKRWPAAHRFRDPAAADAIARAAAEIGIGFPEGLEEFWRFSDGAELFWAEQGEPWGWKLLGTERYLENQHRWRRLFFDHWRTNFLVVAELVNPRGPVVWDGSRMLFLQDNRGMMEERVIADSFSDLVARIDAADGAVWW